MYNHSNYSNKLFLIIIIIFKRARLEAFLIRKEYEETDEDLENKEFIEKIPEPELTIENNKIYLKRPWIKTFLRSKDADYNKPKKVLTERERAERIQRNKLIEYERKKALKKVLERERQKRLGQLHTADEKKEDSLVSNRS
jgi:hypothetical protein